MYHQCRGRRPTLTLIAALAPLLCVFLLGQIAYADEPAAIPVTLKDHRFMPAEIHVPVGRPSVLVVTNLDTTPEEFELFSTQGGKSHCRGDARDRPAAPVGDGALTVYGRVPS